MKLARTDLIARVEAEIARRRQVAAEKTAKQTDEHEQRLAEHVARTGDSWKSFAGTIGRRVRAGKPVTFDDVPFELRSGSYVSVWNRQPPAAVVPAVGPLETLLELLKACPEDEITVASLQRLGFRTADLFRA